MILKATACEFKMFAYEQILTNIFHTNKSMCKQSM